MMFLLTACVQGKPSKDTLAPVPEDSGTWLRTGAECMERYLPFLEGKHFGV